MPKLTQKRKEEILRAVNKGLEWQFESYSWAHMIDDCMLTTEFSKKEIEWAKNNTTYKAFIC